MLPKYISLVCQDMDGSLEIGIVIGRLKKGKDMQGDIHGIETKTTLQLGTTDWRDVLMVKSKLALRL